MLFSVIVSVDGPRALHPGCVVRKSLRHALGGGLQESEYRYLADGHADPEHDPWRTAMGWQGSGMLTRPQFEALVDDLGVHAEDVQTMGSFGGPLSPNGGFVADIAFESEHSNLLISMRVTPIARRGNAVRVNVPTLPLPISEATVMAWHACRAEHMWERLREAMLGTYGRQGNGRSWRFHTDGPKYRQQCMQAARELRVFHA